MPLGVPINIDHPRRSDSAGWTISVHSSFFNCETSSKTAFSICQKCEKVTEILNTKLSKKSIEIKADLPNHMARTWKTFQWDINDVPNDPFFDETF